MAKQKFDFGEKLAARSKVNPGDELRKIEASNDGYEKFILHDEMRPSEDNKYPIDNLEELKESLRVRPLIHNLTVIPVDEENSHYYKILAGERRWRAIGELLAEGNEKFKSGIRCFVIDKNTSETEQKIIMEESNLNQREYTPQARREALERLSELYRQKNLLDGKNIDDNVTKRVAEKAGFGERQAQRYIAVNDRLIPELKTAFDESKITLENAAKFANMDEETQKLVVNLLKSDREVTKNEIELIKKETKKKEDEFIAKLEELQKLVTSSNELNKKLSDDLEIKEHQIEANIRKTDELLKELDEEQNNVKPDQEKVDQLQKEIEKLKNENYEKETEKQGINKQLNQQQRELDTLRKELQKAQKINNEKDKLALSEEEKNKLRDNYELSNIMNDIKKGLTQLHVKTEAYSKKYKESLIDEYYDEIIKKIEEDRRKNKI